MSDAGRRFDVKLLEESLSKLEETYIKAVLLFGSTARGESESKSDVDLLVLHEDCPIKDAVERRRFLYELLLKALRGKFEAITIIDMELKEFLKPKEITSLLLNIYWDAIVVYDEMGSLQSFLNHVRKRIAESGLRRVKNGKAYRWILPEPLKEVKIL